MVPKPPELNPSEPLQRPPFFMAHTKKMKARIESIIKSASIFLCDGVFIDSYSFFLNEKKWNSRCKEETQSSINSNMKVDAYNLSSKQMEKAKVKGVNKLAPINEGGKPSYFLVLEFGNGKAGSLIVSEAAALSTYAEFKPVPKARTAKKAAPKKASAPKKAAAPKKSAPRKKAAPKVKLDDAALCAKYAAAQKAHYLDFIGDDDEEASDFASLQEMKCKGARLSGKRVHMPAKKRSCASLAKSAAKRSVTRAKNAGNKRVKSGVGAGRAASKKCNDARKAHKAGVYTVHL